MGKHCPMLAPGRSRAIAALDVELPERYESFRLLASGGMGSVWRAYDHVLGRMVAIKLLAEGYADDERAVRRFLREGRAAARLCGHPHVITIYDVGDSGGRPYLVMEHLAGGTVADALRAGAVTRADALRWIAEAASALDHAHSLGVLHRDVKPANMLLSRDRVLRLADFGIARLAAEHAITSVNEMLGTVAYMSPEQTRGEPATEASDRYALAVAAFELLVGERPFAAEHFAALARAHQEAPRPSASARNSQLPPALDPVLARGLARRPEDRWGSAQAFAAALQDALSDSPAPPTLLLAPTGGRPVAGRQRPGARAGALATLAAASLALGALLGANQGSGARHPTAPARARARAVTLPGPRPARKSKPTRSAAAVAKPAPAITAATPAATPSAAALEARGHQLMLDGAYPAAIPVLRQAVAAAAPGSLTYAYALFDLGRSLRLAGQPAAAVPVLEQRLRIPDQSGVVRHELKLALAEAGAGAHPPAGAKSAPAPGAAGIGPRDRLAKRRNRSSGHGD